MAFAVGWTPCIGPVLGAILTLAAAQGTTGRTLLLLFAYSLGLGLPIFLLGMGMRWGMGASRFISRNYRWIAGAGGLVMATIGILLPSGVWVRLLVPLLRLVNIYTGPGGATCRLTVVVVWSPLNYGYPEYSITAFAAVA